MGEQISFLKRDGGIDAAALRDQGMQRALEHAEEDVKHWGDLAYTFLVSWCRTQADLFTGEDITDASKDRKLIQPATDKAWGQVIRRAARRGIIVKVDNEGVRSKGHTSPCPRWRSMIHGKPA